MQAPKEISILIAEDDFMVGETIQTELEYLGYTVVGRAQDGRQAVEMTQSLKPDVVFMDIKMPNMDGLEATLHIYQTCPTPVVILTAYDTPALVEQAGEVGAGAYLIKMPTTREIERAIAIATARFGDMLTLRQFNAELQQAMARIKQLSGLLPICANCKKIRNDDGCWQNVIGYIRDHSEAEFTHGICPDCARELYSEFFKESDEQNQDILTALKKLGPWVMLEDISAEISLPENNILSSLQNMVAIGQIRQMELEGQHFYRLSD